MKTKRIYKLGVSLLLAVAMLVFPVGAAFLNGSNSYIVKASDGEENETVSEESTENLQPEESEESTETVPPEETESSTEESTETVSDNDIKEPECICTEKCSTYQVNVNCPVCSEDSTKCGYVAPNVKISVTEPNGWYKDKAEVTIQVEDTKDTGNFKIKTVEARISQNGSWSDITDDMTVEISENCSIYVQVTDQNGKTYTRNKYVECFDKVKPTLNAAINDGLLSIQGIDNDSGIKAIYVNGYEFTELTNGVLNIRLQQFDAGYQYFTLQAVDQAGNMSEVYKTANPYYEDPTVEKDSSDTSKSPASQLPVSATATEPTDAKATVTEHTTDKGTVSDSSVTGNTSKDTATEGTETAEGGKEFYTITTKSDKVFYLIIDKAQTENNVYLLTEVGENDLLNFTESDTETIPQNSAVVESALPDGNTKVETQETEDEAVTETEVEENTEETEAAKKPATGSNAGTYMIMVLALLGVGGAYYYLKFVKGKRESFDDDDYDDEEDVEPEYEKEEDTEEDTADEEADTENDPEEEETFEDSEDDYM